MLLGPHAERSAELQANIGVEIDPIVARAERALQLIESALAQPAAGSLRAVA